MTKRSVVVDTNVAVVANGKNSEAGSGCIANCLSALEHARNNCVVLIDTQARILDEYRRHLSPSGQPGAGDLFMKWLWNNQANAEFCKQVAITPMLGADEDFQEFPRDSRLATFDRSDRKFVAVALASALNPKILNATDTDWWLHRKALRENDVQVSFLCPELME